MRPDEKVRPADSGRFISEAAVTGSANLKSELRLLTLADTFGDVARDALAEAYRWGLRSHWLREAERYEWARPVPGEFHGRRTQAELRTKWHELTELAKACRARAEVPPDRDQVGAA